MTQRLRQSLVRIACRSAAADGGDSDAVLLQRFVATRDPSAFELLVWRHGAMVEGVCRRVLGRAADVDDAFQATFLALLKQAHSVRRGSSVAGWLHRVALRLAGRLRCSSARRLQRETAVARSEAIDPHAIDDLGPILHEEIDRLPDWFRLPIIACQLEGRGVAETARLLGLPRGTVLSRLARGRERLRRALSHRGVAPAVAASALAARESTVSAALVRSAVSTIDHASPAVAGLAQGVIRDMVLTKIKMFTGAALALLVVGFGAVFLAQPVLRAEPDEKPAAKKPATDLDKLQGEWKFSAIVVNGRSEDDDEVKSATMTFTTDKVALRKRPDHKGDVMPFKLIAGHTPARIDFDDDGRAMPGIYELKGDTLRLCFNEKGAERPAEFASKAGTQLVLLELRRAKPGEKEAPKPAAKPRDGNDVRSLQARIAELQALLEQERAIAKDLQAQVEATRNEALRARRLAEQARVEAMAQRELAESQRARSEKLLKEAQDAIDRARKAEAKKPK